MEEEAVVGVRESENERGGRGDADGVELRLVLGDELVLGNCRGEGLHLAFEVLQECRACGLM